MFCTKCGKELPEGAKFCTKCGKPVVEKKEVSEEKPVVKEAPKKEQPVAKEPTAPKKKGKAGIVILIIIIVILAGVALTLGGVIAYNYFVGNETSVEQEIDEDEDSDDEDEDSDDSEAEEEETEEDTESTEEEKSTTEEIEDKTEEAENDDYVLPNSDTEYLTEEDIEDLTLQELNYAKNEIYARHGRKFDSQELREYFESKDWYEGTIEPANFSDSSLSAVEKANAKLLRDKEFSIDSKGYQLDQ